jgi:hypothetical protein
MDEGRQQTKRWVEIQVPDAWTLDEAANMTCEIHLGESEKLDVRLMRREAGEEEEVCVARFPAVP